MHWLFRQIEVYLLVYRLISTSTRLLDLADVQVYLQAKNDLLCARLSALKVSEAFVDFVQPSVPQLYRVGFQFPSLHQTWQGVLKERGEQCPFFVVRLQVSGVHSISGWNPSDWRTR